MIGSEIETVYHFKKDPKEGTYKFNTHTIKEKIDYWNI